MALTTGSSAGVIIGRARELVYNTDGSILSELDWPLQPAVCLGASVEASLPLGPFISGAAQLALPGLSGSMTDSDYNMNGSLEDYSQSDSMLASAVTAELRLGWHIRTEKLGPLGAISPFLGFQYLEFAWSAQNGYYQYPSTAAPEPLYGTVGIYQQTYLIPEAGLGAFFPFSKNLALSVSFAGSPYLWVNDIDEHPLRAIKFTDAMRGGYLLQPELRLDGRIARSASVSLDVLYRRVAGVVGDTTETTTGTSEYVVSVKISTSRPGALTWRW
jgi:outer membrane protease